MPKQYLVYVGPNTVLGLGDKTRSLVQGQKYDDLPTDHPQVINLMAQKLLTPRDTVAAAQPHPVKPEEAKPASKGEDK